MNNTKVVFDIELFAFSTGMHNDKKVIWISFPNDRNLINFLKDNTKAKWSPIDKKWYVADTEFYRNLLGIELKIVGKATLTKISNVNLYAFQ